MIDNSTMLLGVIGVLWTTTFAISAAYLAKFSTKQEKIGEKIDKIVETQACFTEKFADKAMNHSAHKEIYGHLHNHDQRITTLEVRCKLDERIDKLVERVNH